MRPELLQPLFAEVEALKGVGPRIAKALERLKLTRVVDLAFHLPTGRIERVRTDAVNHALVGQIVIVEAEPFDLREGRGRAPTRIFARDADDIAVGFTSRRDGSPTRSGSPTRTGVRKKGWVVGRSTV